ncbi:hypothetical protein ACFY5J_27660 [Peribacillus butanolivorans]|nr:hypothetical protein [Peribacillus butanolivorans]
MKLTSEVWILDKNELIQEESVYEKFISGVSDNKGFWCENNAIES